MDRRDMDRRDMDRRDMDRRDMDRRDMDRRLTEVSIVRVPRNWPPTRLGGWIIDFLILVVVDLLVDIPLRLIHSEHLVVSGVRTVHYRLGPLGIAINAVISILYGGLLCGSSRGQTLGMMVTPTRAVRVGDAHPIGVPRAFGRAAFEYLMAVALVVPWIIDMLFPLWDAQEQTLHDKVAGTIVISTE
jgi:uncharacterized RDD family membrane protein YckC